MYSSILEKPAFKPVTLGLGMGLAAELLYYFFL